MGFVNKLLAIEIKPVLFQRSKEKDMKTGAMSIEKYVSSKMDDRFDFIYKNFPIIKEMIADYKEELITEVLEQKLYNRKSDFGDLGVRVQISGRITNLTQSKAIEHMSIVKAIEDGLLDEEFFEDTDNRKELVEKVTCFLGIQADVIVFERKLRSLSIDDQKVLRPYLRSEKSIRDLESELGIDYQSVCKRVYRIRKKLWNNVAPKMVLFEGKVD